MMSILRRWNLVSYVAAAGLILSLAACGTDADAEGGDEFGVAVDGVDEFGKPTLDSTGWEEPAGKADAMQGRPGLPVSVDDSSTAVWEVENSWTDRDTAAARQAGLAWGEDSGLSWEEKFHVWVDNLPRIEREGYGETFLLTTPYGVEVPSPSLECAEVAIFLRVAFASWHHLPFFMEAVDGNGQRVYFGHFGIRTADGRYGRMANFKTAYNDYSDMADAIRSGEASWPSDATLAGRGIPGASDDSQPMIGPNAKAGAYFDHVFLNKRVGYFLLMNLVYFGSINLADPVNTFHIAPESTRAGDTLLHRWQRQGIGHVMIVMEADRLGEGDELQMEATVASGSMPRRQPLWESPASSKGQFTNRYAGGPEYVEFNGGLKRWRIAENINGRWTNVVSQDFGDDFISASERPRLAERPGQYETLLTEIAPEDRLDAMAAIVEQHREHLRLYPASCVARNNRENAFDELYAAGADMGLSREDIDAQYRLLEDYVFAALEYGESKTCCWNSSTSDMHQLVVDYNRELAEQPVCQEPVVFKARDDGGDGYELFREYADSVGKGDLWVDWSADENCPQVNGWVEDVLQERDVTPWCEFQNEPSEPGSHSFHNNQTIPIPDNDPEGIRSPIEVDVVGEVRAVEIDLYISHTYNGDLLINLIKDGIAVEVYNGSGPGNDVLLIDHEVHGFEGIDAAGTWELEVIDRMAIDEGELEEWSLHLEVR